MAPRDARQPPQEETDQAARGRPVGVGWPTYGETAATLFENGYEPLPIVPGTKRPALSRWTATAMDPAMVGGWAKTWPDHGIGLRTGALVGLDIDILDPDLAHRIHRLAIRRLGEAPMRVGLWPKRLLLYRTETPQAKMSVGAIEVLGLGQQFVAFGQHPETGAPYYWPEGETPLDLPLPDLPRVDAAGLEAFLAEAAALLPEPAAAAGRRKPAGAPVAPIPGPLRDGSGRVIDGRDGWLSSIAFHAIHDVLDAGETPDADRITGRVWARFETTADIARARKDGSAAYGWSDARRKVDDKLRLLRDGRLPDRDRIDAGEAVEDPGPLLPVAEARVALDDAIAGACEAIRLWHAGRGAGPVPQIGIRATVGLGKSVAARRQLLRLREALISLEAPDRIAVFTPSHALAEEAAAAWRREGLRVAVHRGYDRRCPTTSEPLCRDPDAVHTAIAVGLRVHQAACNDGAGHRCRHFDGCLKQANRCADADADVVVAAYDALSTGFGVECANFGVLLIDEACWPRARRDPDRIDLDRVAAGELSGLRTRGGEIGAAAATADLHELRTRLAAALRTGEPGPLRRATLDAGGLSAKDCLHAAALETRRLRDPGLKPGAPEHVREAARGDAAWNAEARRHARFWRALAAFLEGGGERSGRVRLATPGGSERGAEAIVEGVQRVQRSLRDVPVLHLDATLRPELAETVLPRLATTAIGVAAPHMSLRLVSGSFGKGALIPDPRACDAENRRRAGKLACCVDHVRWQARRAAPGRTLVITYKHCEAAFRDLPGVETAHFNAIAGLDLWRDVAQLIVIGRPLPRDREVATMAGAFFDRVAEGGYGPVRRGVRMRDGSVRTVRALGHADDAAETIRAAICEDELIQAIGRGRGVNRTAATPLEVHVLADVALPLIHDHLVPWDVVRPDILQRMLLAGVAVDSPEDAARMHPALFANGNQAKKQFQAIGFKGRSPMSTSYRGMTLKCASYRLPGRGRSWSGAYWIDGSASDVKSALTATLGALAEWKPQDDA